MQLSSSNNTAAGQSPAVLSLDFPEKLEKLFIPQRYKVLYGGRGGAKSWGIARALLIQVQQATLRVLCVREFQNSMADSVHKVLSDQIELMGFGGRFDIQRDKIICLATGSTFSFEGIKQNASRIKSYEGIDRCWVEEANLVTKSSWEILIPTIRKEDSEIWISFNPELETDETYRRFVKDTPKNCFLIPMSWRDNQWFPKVLYDEMLELRDKDFDAYLNIWEGQCRQMLDGAVYAEELRAAQASGRICKVPHDPTIKVDTIWDLGWADATTIWLRQQVGFELHYIKYLQNSQKPLEWYLRELQKLPYVWGTDWLPHDAKAKQLGTGRSVEEMMRAAGRRVQVIPKLSVADGINAARTIFPNCYFDETECAEGLQCLRHYRYEVVKESDGVTLSKVPLHDWSSHGADSFRMSAIASRKRGNELVEDLEVLSSKPRRGPPRLAGLTGWMR